MDETRGVMRSDHRGWCRGTSTLQWWMAMALVLLAVSIPAQGSSEASASPQADDAAAIQARIEELSGRIAASEAATTSDIAMQRGVAVTDLANRVERLKSLRDLYEQQGAVLRQIEAATNAVEEVKKQTAEFQGLPEKPPYAIAFVDSLEDVLDAQVLEHETDQSDVVREGERLKEAQRALDEATRARRLAKEELERGAGGDVAPKLQWEFEGAGLAYDLAEASVALQRRREELSKLVVEADEARRDLQQRKVNLARASLQFRRNELDEKTAGIADRANRTEKELREAQIDSDTRQAQVQEAREALQQARGEEAIERGRLLLDMRQAQALTAERIASLLGDFLKYLSMESEIWHDRFEIINHPRDVDLAVLEKAAKTRQETLANYRQNLDSRMRVVRASLAEQDQLLASWQGANSDKSVAKQKLDALTRRDEQLDRNQTYLGNVERLNARLQEGIAAQRQHVGWGQRVQRVTSAAKKVWDYKVIVGDEPLTVKEIVAALLILVLGAALSRRATRILRRQALERFKLEANVAAVIEKLTYYFLLIFVVLFALQTVNIPLTVFTFFGGALAIGVGFGAQNLINNFISGLILLAERPIKLGDVVEVDGERGRIVNIGARCSTLHLFSGVDILVPNSAFLEKNVVNWTLSDPVVRFSVTVGVAYGSPTREVSQLIMKSVEEHGKILKNPEPLVLFSDFGDNAFIFDVYFWLMMTTMMDARAVCSDVRFRIDKLFREAGITIAFPQRDIHVDTLRPLDVRLIKDVEKSEQKEEEK